MGCVPSHSQIESFNEKYNHEIEAQLKQDRIRMAKEVKILLLGAGESGKSTVVKQMRRMYNHSFIPQERADFRDVIFANFFSSVLVVIQSFTLLAVPVPPSLQAPIDLLLARAHQGGAWLPGENTGVLPTSVGEAAVAVWTSEAGQEVMRRATSVQLNDSAGYFFEAAERLTTPGYVPTDQDILRARVKSTGITETTFDVRNLTFRVLDPGGQRSERKKWVHCFEAVDVLLFVIAVSEFPQRLREDEGTNRLSEAFVIWRSIAASRWFRKTAMVVFMNKIDLLKERLFTHRFADFVPDYPRDRSNSYADVSGWLVKRTVEEWRGTEALHVHLTQATDEDQVHVVLFAVSELIFKRNLERSGII